MNPGDIVWFTDEQGEPVKGRITDVDSDGRVKAEFWLWPAQLQED